MKNKENLSISPLDEKNDFFWLKCNKTKGILTQSLPYKKWLFLLRWKITKGKLTLTILEEKNDFSD